MARLASAAILGLIAILAAASFLPLVESDAWWIRFMDFPRLQLAVALLVLLAALLAVRRPAGRLGWAAAALAAAAVGYHAVKLLPFADLPAQAAAGVEDCAPGAALTIMVANVQKRNETADAFLRLVADTDPDLLLVIETDAWWDRRLAALADTYPERVQSIPNGEAAFGMHLLSRLPLVAPEFRFLFDADTPTLLTGVALGDGAVAQLVGLHPRPPLAWSQPTTLRDGSLLTAALEARASPAPTILAGDFNAVPWEPVTRRAARIGGLLDPRVGRGLYPSFGTDGVLVSWPLDQVLMQPAFGLLDFAMLPDIGSDHYPILARLCHAPDAAGDRPAPPLRPDDLEEADASIAAARALDP